ncbi:hypothetical protein FM112_10650 [Gulosibacter sp. 10]|nr:hypothetical protein FM112_10650 [Gulosibacter sp. 10]
MMTPARIRRAVRAAPAADPTTAPTRILDHDHPDVRRFLRSIDREAGPRERDPQEYLRAAHRRIRDAIRPVYSMADTRSVSGTLRRGRGSCSQRFAVLEAAARARGIPTRSRGLVMDGEFWYPRFPMLRRAVPRFVLLAWPELRLDGEWVSVTRALAGPGRADAGPSFGNAGAETLFDAVGRGAADWRAAGVQGCACDDAAFARFVRRDLGTHSSRDELFARYGQNLPGPVRLAVEPLFGRWSAGATSR